MENIISTLEIALFIMFPLVIFYKQRKSNIRFYFIAIPVLYIVWYLTYMLLHELTHWLGAWICGKEVFDYKLFPEFWKGDFGTGFIKYDFKGDKKDFFIIILPYLRDILSLFAGYWILNHKKVKSLFWAGFILIMLILSPLYDISNNYLAYLFGSLNDFNALKISSTSFMTNFIGILFMCAALFATYRTIRSGNSSQHCN
jgi:hypothetical protein